MRYVGGARSDRLSVCLWSRPAFHFLRVLRFRDVPQKQEVYNRQEYSYCECCRIEVGQAGYAMSKRRTDTYCFAPGCHSGYPAGAPKASLFAAPMDDELRKKWEQNWGRLDKLLTISLAVGERHFGPECIYIAGLNPRNKRL